MVTNQEVLIDKLVLACSTFTFQQTFVFGWQQRGKSDNKTTRIGVSRFLARKISMPITSAAHVHVRRQGNGPTLI